MIKKDERPFSELEIPPEQSFEEWVFKKFFKII